MNLTAVIVALSILAAPPQFPPCVKTPTTSETRIVCLDEQDLYRTMNRLTTGWEICKSDLKTCKADLADMETRPAVVESKVSFWEWLGVVGIGAALGAVTTVYIYERYAK